MDSKDLAPNQLVKDNNPYDLSGTSRKINSSNESYYKITFDPELSSLFDSSNGNSSIPKKSQIEQENTNERS